MAAATADYAWIYPRLVESGVTITTQSFVERVEPGSITVSDAWSGGTRQVPADSVVLVMTRRSDDALYRSLAERGSSVVRVGDCVAPREVDDAVYEGMRCGLTL